MLMRVVHLMIMYEGHFLLQSTVLYMLYRIVPVLYPIKIQIILFLECRFWY